MSSKLHHTEIAGPRVASTRVPSAPAMTARAIESRPLRAWRCARCRARDVLWYRCRIHGARDGVKAGMLTPGELFASSFVPYLVGTVPDLGPRRFEVSARAFSCGSLHPA